MVFPIVSLIILVNFSAQDSAGNTCLKLSEEKPEQGVKYVQG